MQGVTFGNYHSWRDWGLLLQSKEIGSPSIKVNKIDIPGADGDLDMTDYFGGAKYENVKHKFEFATLAQRTEHLTLFSSIKNAIHGKKGRIIIDGDPSFFYLGRCSVSAFTNDKGAGFVTVECDCEPYKYKLAKTVVTQAVDGTETVTLTNGRKRAVPTITTTAPMTIAFGEGMWTHSAGTFSIPELELLEGNNDVPVTGVGNITFTWQEGDL
jgi:phage-related protein